MDIQQALKQIVEQQSLTAEEMQSVMQQLMTGQCTDAQIGGFLVGLRMKGETVDEILGAARVMRELSARVNVDPKNLVDTCGTGGDGANTFNISTASAFVAAAAGARVAKHGNRSVSSSSGSADLLEKAGVNLQLSPEQVARCIDEVGVGFMFAPAHHGAMKYAIGPRREMAIRTLFNLLGPLTNPAGAPNQVMGIFSREWLRPLAEVFQLLGSEHVLVVHSRDGLDEISIADATDVAELYQGEIREYTISPEDFGLERASLDSLAVDSAAESLETIRAVFDNQPGPARDIVALNGGAAIYAAGITATLPEGVAMAQDVIATGQAREKLQALVDLSSLMK